MGTITISTTELERDFGRYQEAALHEPITITDDGRETLVLLSIESYRALRSGRHGDPVAIWDLNDAEIDALVHGEIPEEAEQYNHELD